jgi:hypothetical protein
MPECIQCGDVRERDKMLSLDSWIDPPENPELVCVRCASVAMKGGPENMTDEQLEAHNVVIE